MRREPPTIVGDGVHTVRELTEIENKNPKREGPIFHHITLDADTDEEIKRQGLTWDAIPAVGRVVTLSQKVGRGSGGITRDVTDITHPDNKELFEKIGRVLADPLVGVDFIIQDIDRSWKDQKACGVIECNSLPFIDLHHYPYAGQVRDAAGALWNLIFPASAPSTR
jgi:cyanophycin synthetase